MLSVMGAARARPALQGEGRALVPTPAARSARRLDLVRHDSATERAGTRQFSTGCRMEWSVAVKFDRSSAPMTCARSLALASSSRSQVAVPTARAAASLAWERPSVSVRWRPLLAVAIVTHLVTQLASQPGIYDLSTGDGAPTRLLRLGPARGARGRVITVMTGRRIVWIWEYHCSVV